MPSSKDKNNIFKNKNVIITGAGGGLGSLIAEEFSRVGCNIFLLSRRKEKIINLSKRIKSNLIGYSIIDFNDLLSFNNEINKINKKYSFDIIVNCAGIFPVLSIKESSYQKFEECLKINVIAPLELIRTLSPKMKKNKWGRIINIGSSSSYAGFKNTTMYCASKHALLGMSRSIAEELKPFNVRSISVSPGSIKTEMGKKVIGQNYNDFINPNEVAKLIVQICAYDNNMLIDEISLKRMKIK